MFTYYVYNVASTFVLFYTVLLLLQHFWHTCTCTSFLHAIILFYLIIPSYSIYTRMCMCFFFCPDIFNTCISIESKDENRRRSHGMNVRNQSQLLSIVFRDFAAYTNVHVHNMYPAAWKGSPTLCTCTSGPLPLFQKTYYFYLLSAVMYLHFR